MSNPLRNYVDTVGRGAQSRLAALTGLSKGLIGDLVSGRREPSLSQIRLFHRVTDGAIAFADWNDPGHAANRKNDPISLGSQEIENKPLI